MPIIFVKNGEEATCWLVWMTTIQIPWDLFGDKFVGALLLEAPRLSCCSVVPFPVYFWVSPYTTTNKVLLLFRYNNMCVGAQTEARSNDGLRRCGEDAGALLCAYL